MALLALFRGWRPSSRGAAVLLAGPLLTVGIAAGAVANPFNAAVFVALSLAVLATSWRVPESWREPAAPSSRVKLLGAGLLIGVGLVYPHFVEGASPLTYLYAAPVGLLPCPTLAVVMGVTLLQRGLDIPWWRAVLGLASFFSGRWACSGWGSTWTRLC